MSRILTWGVTRTYCSGKSCITRSCFRNFPRALEQSHGSLPGHQKWQQTFCVLQVFYSVLELARFWGLDELMEDQIGQQGSRALEHRYLNQDAPTTKWSRVMWTIQTGKFSSKPTQCLLLRSAGRIWVLNCQRIMMPSTGESPTKGAEPIWLARRRQREIRSRRYFKSPCRIAERKWEVYTPRLHFHFDSILITPNLDGVWKATVPFQSSRRETFRRPSAWTSEERASCIYYSPESVCNRTQRSLLSQMFCIPTIYPLCGRDTGIATPRSAEGFIETSTATHRI